MSPTDPFVTTGDVTDDQAREAVAAALKRIVPDADLEELVDDTAVRSELELDSLDFLTFVELLSKSTGVRIDEDDYPQLTTMRSCVAFLTAAR
jgi:acyl carrier protein